MASFIFTILLILLWGTSVLPALIDNSTMLAIHEEWMTKYGRIYGSNEELKRRYKVFKTNVKHINAHNSMVGRMYDMELNRFADMTIQEFEAKYTGFLERPAADPMNARHQMQKSVDDVPTSVDWRKKGAIGDIKDQQKCGSCWAYAAVAAIEAIVQIKTGELLDLSEQELIDCDYSDSGCSGGDVSTCFSWILKNGGINSEKNYPAKGSRGKCDKGASSVSVANITGFHYVPSNDEKALQVAVSKQPVTVAIATASDDFLFYKGGIFNGTCGPRLDHVFTVVGYNVSGDGIPFWIAKNSWGNDWGEEGYMKILRDVNDKRGMCGLAMRVQFPIKE